MRNMPPMPDRTRSTPARSSTAVQTVEASVRKALGGAELTEEWKKAIETAVNDATDRRVKAHIDRVANKEVAQSLADASDLRSAVASTARVAFEAAQSIAASEDYIKSLGETAKMMKAKFDSYVSVGFAPEQAFRLLEAEIFAKARLRPGG